MKKSLLTGLLFLLWSGVAAATDCPQYSIKANVDVAEKKIAATQTVSFQNLTAQELRDVYLYIYPNRRYTPQEERFMLRFGGYFKVDPFPGGFPRGGMKIRSVTAGGKELAYQIEGKDETLLRVTLDPAIQKGESITFSVDFEVGIPQAFGRFGWYENVIKASHWYPQLAVVDDRGWRLYPFYPFHRPFFSEAAQYNVELTAPQTQVIIHSGDLEQVIKQADGTQTLLIKTADPIREFSFAMSPDYQMLSEDYQGVTIKSYYLPGDQERARQVVANVKDVMTSYAQFFGPYPYREFRIAPVPLGYGGEQMANLIFIDTRAYRLPGFLDRYFDFLISHETGHQWLYNVVGIDEYSQMWLEEGVNSFFISKHLEGKYGKDANVIQYPRWFKDWEWTLPPLTFRRARDYRYKIFARQGFDDPVVRDLSSFQEPSSIFALAYGKGSRIVGMLQSSLGEETFARVWKRIYADYRFKNFTVKDLQRICEEESGKKLDWFFEQWLFSPGKLNYAVAGVQGQRITLQNRGDIRMPVAVQVTFKDGQQQAITWDGQKKEEVISLPGSSPIAKVAIDPEDDLLDIDRTNNFWPRQINLKPVPLYLGIYDIPVFLPEDSYNIVVGPEMANSGFGIKVSAQKPYDQNIYAATDYEFSESLQHSRAGYQLKNVFQSPTTLGVEIRNTSDYDGGEEDLVSGKVSLRRELWPAAYGFTDINDHVSLYLIRNQNINDGADYISGREDARNVDYSRRQEAITGVNLHLNRSGPYPDPKLGYQLETFYENAGHFLGATQYFNRAVVDVSAYQPVTTRSNLAFRMKYGWGAPDDKNLYYLGGSDGLRGYELKTLRGANALLGSMEYRFPIKEQLHWSCLDHLLGLEAVKGVVFFDVGQSWYDDLADTSLKKDAGIGLRFTVNIGSFLEKVIVRLDVAQAINDADEDTRFWFGINQAF